MFIDIYPRIKFPDVIYSIYFIYLDFFFIFSEISDKPIHIPLEPIKNNLYQESPANNRNTNQGSSSNTDQIQETGNTKPIMDENVNSLPTFNSESIPNSQYFNKADERN